MKKVRWALIGCGKVVLKNKFSPFINNKNKIVAICTTSIEHSYNAIKKLKLKDCNGYDNAIKMINTEKVDAVYICTPPYYHYIYLQLLSNYNLNLIYVEKPFVLNFKQAVSVLKLYKNKQTKIFVAHYKRLTPQIQRIKKIISSKKYGNILSIEGCFSRKFDINMINNSWIYNKRISGGGRFFDISPHIFDVLYYLFGDFTKINSKVFYEQKEHNCESGVIVDFKIKNIPCNLSFNFNSNIDKDILIVRFSKNYLKTSINRSSTIFFYNDSGKIIKKIKFPATKVWGIENIKEFDKLIFQKEYNHDLANLQDACTIQKYIDIILH